MMVVVWWGTHRIRVLVDEKGNQPRRSTDSPAMWSYAAQRKRTPRGSDSPYRQTVMGLPVLRLRSGWRTYGFEPDGDTLAGGRENIITQQRFSVDGLVRKNNHPVPEGNSRNLRFRSRTFGSGVILDCWFRLQTFENRNSKELQEDKDSKEDKRTLPQDHSCECLEGGFSCVRGLVRLTHLSAPESRTHPEEPIRH